MNDDYDIVSQSRQNALVNDVSLDTDIDEKSGRRWIIRPEIVLNEKNPDAYIKIGIHHQRRHTRKERWKDIDSFDLRHLKAGEEVCLNLNSQQTLKLHQELQHLYALGANGVPMGEQTLTVIDSDLAELLKDRKEIFDILANQDQNFWDTLQQAKPDLMKELADAQRRLTRKEAVEEFESRMLWEKLDESDWEDFFRKNRWIFGHGLAYQFLDEVQKQPHYGGTSIDGKGAERGDFFMATEAGVRFSVLVEIKKPETSLLSTELHRRGSYRPSIELAGAVSQIQANIHTWITDGSLSHKNVRELDKENICTFEPKGILVIGNSAELNDYDKRRTFQLFRRNLHNPEIITYDELLARAKYLVEEV